MSVYFAQSEQTNLIKIGRSLNINERLMFLRSRTKQDFKLLGWMNGSYKEERALHLKFADWRHDREWFEPDPFLLDYIARKAFLPPAPPPENGKSNLAIWVNAELMEALQRRAIANGRVVSQEVRFILCEAVGQEPSIRRYCMADKPA